MFAYSLDSSKHELWYSGNRQTFLPLSPNGLRGGSHVDARRVYGITTRFVGGVRHHPP